MIEIPGFPAKWRLRNEPGPSAHLGQEGLKQMTA